MFTWLGQTIVEVVLKQKELPKITLIPPHFLEAAWYDGPRRWKFGFSTVC